MWTALARAGLRAVLTGGGCATIYSGGEYQSDDLDLILQSTPTQKSLDRAMALAGFQREVDRYTHPKSRFFVEFVRGPLSIGRDVQITPVELEIGDARIAALSPTDSCRDRLAAFYFWNDRQSLDAAVAIAKKQRVDRESIRKWSVAEGASSGFEEFERKLDQHGRRRPASRRRPP